jgi:HNH endonuclease
MGQRRLDEKSIDERRAYWRERLAKLEDQRSNAGAYPYGHGRFGSWLGDQVNHARENRIAEARRELRNLDTEELSAPGPATTDAEGFESASPMVPVNPALIFPFPAERCRIDHSRSAPRAVDIHVSAENPYAPATAVETELARGLALLESGSSEALPHFVNAAAASNHRTVVASLFAGASHLSAGNPADAADHLERVLRSRIRIDSGFPIEGEWLDSLEERSQHATRSLSTDLVVARLGISGAFLVPLGDEAALEIPLSSIVAAPLLSFSYEMQGRDEQAHQLLRVIVASTNSVALKPLLAAAQARRERWSDLLDTLGSIEINKSTLYLGLLKAQALEAQGVDDAARTLYADILRGERDPLLRGAPVLKEARYRRGHLHLRSGRRAQARKDFARIAAEDIEYRDVADLLRGQDLGRAAADPRRQPIPTEVKDRVWRRDEGRCVNCGSQVNLEFDHVIPLAMGGSNTERNIQLLCERCNRAKGHELE